MEEADNTSINKNVCQKRNSREKMNVMQNKLFFSILIAGLLTVVIALCWLMYVSAPQFSDFELIGKQGGRTEIYLPYYRNEYPTGVSSFKGKINYSFYGQGLLRIIPDDVVEHIKINGKNVSLEKVDPPDLADYNNGFFYNIAPFLNYGENSIEIAVNNKGGRFGLSLYSELNKYLFEFVASIIILMMVFLLLKHEIQEAKASMSIVLFIFMITVSALVLRFLLFKHLSGDYFLFLSPWFDFIKENGFRASFRERFSDYTPLYLYFLALCTLLPLQKIVAIKGISLFFDFLAAICVFKMIRRNLKESIVMPTLGYSLFLFAPTVALNSAFWGQSDIFYAVFCLLSIYFIMNQKYFISAFLYGIAVSVKLQAIFLAPFFLIFYMQKEMPLRYFIIIPIIYLVTLIPTIAAGRPIVDLLSIYISQSQNYQSLTLNAPSVYQWLPNDLFRALNIPATLYAAGLVLILIFWLHFRMESKSMSNQNVIQLALLFAVFVPFFLPKMHERYFFLADAIALVYAHYFPKRFFIAPTIWLSSFFSYWPFLFGVEIIPIKYISLVMLAMICCLLYFVSESSLIPQKESLAEAGA